MIFEKIISLHRHKSIDGQRSGAKLPNPQGKLFKEMYTFDVAIALLTAASSSGQQCDGTVLYAMLIAYYVCAVQSERDNFVVCQKFALKYCPNSRKFLSPTSTKPYHITLNFDAKYN